jgi:hypothetical protein
VPQRLSKFGVSVPATRWRLTGSIQDTHLGLCVACQGPIISQCLRQHMHACSSASLFQISCIAYELNAQAIVEVHVSSDKFMGTVNLMLNSYSWRFAQIPFSAFISCMHLIFEWCERLTF